MDIIKIKAEVYQLEQQGKRLLILHYLQDVWQQEPQSEGLTVLALRQMVAYADTVVQFSENSPLWEAKNEYSLYKAFLLDIISWGAEKLPHEQAVPMANVLLSQSGIHLLLYVRQGDNGRKCGLMEEDAVSGSRPAISGQLAFQVH